MNEEYGTVTVADAFTTLGGPPAVDVIATCRVLSPGCAPAGAVTVKCSVTVCPGATVTGAGRLAVQPAGTCRANRACGIAESPWLTRVAVTVAGEPGVTVAGADRVA